MTDTINRGQKVNYREEIRFLSNKEARKAFFGLVTIAALFTILIILINIAFKEQAFIITIVLANLSFILIIIKLIAVFREIYVNISSLSAYVRKIAANEFTYDIRDNNEGYISILRNDIYKITVMLNENNKKEQYEKEYLANAIAEISHQLKTPLTSMQVMTELLRENLPIEKKLEFLSSMEKQLNRLTWITSALLKISKLDAKTIQLEKEKVNVTQLVNKALGHLAIPIELKQHSIKIIGDENVYYTGDFNWSVEALLNIIKNCIEHTPQFGYIGILFSHTPLYTQIIIEDNGSGISKEDLPYIFKRFYKGKNSSPDSVGIGLAMAKAIIENQGGHIAVTSKHGEGTKFDIKFYKDLK